MEKIIANKFGCQIIERENRIFIRYDTGGSTSTLNESEITKEEAERAVISEKDAYEVILKAKERESKNDNGE